MLQSNLHKFCNNHVLLLTTSRQLSTLKTYKTSRAIRRKKATRGIKWEKLWFIIYKL